MKVPVTLLPLFLKDLISPPFSIRVAGVPKLIPLKSVPLSAFAPPAKYIFSIPELTIA